MEDVVYLKNGSIIHGTIIEQIPNQSIKVKTKDGSVFVYNMTEVEKMTKEELANSYSENIGYSMQGNQLSQVAIPSYKMIKGMYNPKMYVSRPGDPYNPIVSGVCSWIIPGLGQMLSGETGRGLGYLGGFLGFALIGGVGSGIAVSSYSDGGIIAGSLIMVVGYVGMLGIDIASIVDAVRVAKVKNMYLNDPKNRASMNFEIAPYIEQISMNNQIVTPVGMTMRIKF